MFAVPARFVGFILQAWSNLGAMKAMGEGAVPTAATKIITTLFSFHVTHIFPLLPADGYVIQSSSFQTRVPACVCAVPAG